MKFTALLSVLSARIQGSPNSSKAWYLVAFLITVTKYLTLVVKAGETYFDFRLQKTHRPSWQERQSEQLGCGLHSEGLSQGRTGGLRAQDRNQGHVPPCATFPPAWPSFLRAAASWGPSVQIRSLELSVVVLAEAEELVQVCGRADLRQPGCTVKPYHSQTIEQTKTHSKAWEGTFKP